MPTAQKNLDRQQRLFGFTFLAMLLFAVTFAIYVYAEWRLDRANERRFTSFALADELRQSSDDLTRMVRSYIATANPKYKAHFHEIIAIRDGLAPRPANYNLVYWDLVLIGEPPPANHGKPVSLLNLMQEAGFSEQEMDKLYEAKQQSDLLSALELRAMSIVDLAANAEEIQAIKLRQQAMSSLYDDEYIHAKARIMRPINDFYHLVDERTRDEVAQTALHARVTRGIFLLVTGILCWLLWQIQRYTRHVLGCSLGELYQHILHIGEDKPLPAISYKPDTILGWLMETAAHLQQLSAQKAAIMNELENQAMIDSLTRLPNRRALVGHLEQALRQQPPPRLLLAYLDLDGFKPINDRYGHAAGDLVLSKVAEQLHSRHLPPDFAARIGGDEFVLALPDRLDHLALQEEMRQLAWHISQPIAWQNQFLSVTVSIGLTEYIPAHRVSADQLISQADHAMYQAKQIGKNGVHFYIPDSHTHA